MSDATLPYVLIRTGNPDARWSEHALIMPLRARDLLDWADRADETPHGKPHVLPASSGWRLPLREARALLAIHLPGVDHGPSPGRMHDKGPRLAPLFEPDLTGLESVHSEPFIYSKFIEFGYQTRGDSAVLGRTSATEARAFAPLLARDPDELADAFRRFAPAGADVLDRVLSDYADGVPSVAGYVLRQTFPDGLPQDAVLALLEHDDPAIREMAMSSFHRFRTRPASLHRPQTR